ncbi:hypothetical protein GCM10007901_09380 [Dyella acidisoli]|uniref:Uncharacterized protein n=1 Tax=Dyella acidisoli TaxID=1867834 RepID=A0ABQ5XK23_9GAMM|nr:hypothetical protein GCM10007901_09380 [Dyella acidisoli]
MKSKTNTSQFDDYAERFNSAAHTRMFYVWHTGVIKRGSPPNIRLWGPGVIDEKSAGSGTTGLAERTRFLIRSVH